MTHRSFSTAFGSALMLHVLGLMLLSCSLETWRGVPVSLPPAATMRVAVVPEPEPAPLPVAPPEPEPDVPPVVDTAAEPLPPALTVPLPVAPPPQPPPAPPKPLLAPLRALPAPRPVQTPPVTQVPKRQPVAHTAPPVAPRRSSVAPGEGGGGMAGSPPGAPTPEPLPSAGGADMGRLAAQGGLPVAADTGSGNGSGGAGSGSEGSGTGSARVGAGSGTGSGVGSGHGGAGAGSGSGNGSARPLGGYQVTPRYPESARRQGIEGTSVLKMFITAQGQVEDVRVERSAGYGELDQAAMEAVRRWRFEPARRGGVAVAMWVVIPVAFKLL